METPTGSSDPESYEIYVARHKIRWDFPRTTDKFEVLVTSLKSNVALGELPTKSFGPYPKDCPRVPYDYDEKSLVTKSRTLQDYINLTKHQTPTVRKFQRGLQRLCTGSNSRWRGPCERVVRTGRGRDPGTETVLDRIVVHEGR